METQRTFTPHGAPIRNAKLLPVQPPGKIIGRNHELGLTHAAIKGGSAVFLSGQSGIGKTALASILSAAYIASNAGGVLWFNVLEDDVDLLIARVGRAYGVNALSVQGDSSDNADVVQALLKKNRPLIVLDGLIDLSAAREFIQRCAADLPMIIANDSYEAGPWQSFPLAPLSSADSAQFFKFYFGLDDPLYAADIDGLNRFLGGIPMAMELAARQLAVDRQTPAELLTSLPSTSVRNGPSLIMSVVFKHLSPSAQAMLLVLAATPTGAATAELIGDLSNVPAANIVPLMRQLVSRGLAHESVTYGQFAYSLQESAQIFTRGWLEQYQRLQLTENRALQAIVKYVGRHAHNSVTDHDRLAAEIDNIVNAAAYATSTNQGSIVRQLIHSLTQQAGDFVASRGFEPELGEMIKLSTLVSTADIAPMSTQTTAAVPVAPPASSRPTPPPAPRSIDDFSDIAAVAQTAEDEPEAAPELPSAPADATQILRPAVVAAAPAEPDEAESDSDDTASQPSYTVGTAELTQLADAVPEAEPADEVAEESFAEDIVPEPATDTQPPQSTEPLVPVMDSAPELPEADTTQPAPQIPEPISETAEITPIHLFSEPLPPHQAAPPVSQPISQPIRQPQPVIQEPPVSKEDTETPTDFSIPTIESHLEDARANNDLPREASLLQTLGRYYSDQGNLTEAQNHYNASLEIYEQLNDNDGMLANLDALAEIAVRNDDVQDALLFATRGVNLARQTGERDRLGRLQTRLGDVRMALGDPASAIETYTQAVEALRRGENWLTIGSVMTKLGTAYLENNQPQEATMILDQARSMLQRARNPEYETKAVTQLGAAALAMKQLPQAQKYYEQGLRLSRANAQQDDEAAQLSALGHLRELQSDPAGAIAYHRQALHVGYLLNDSQLQATSSFDLGRLLMDDTRTLNQATQLLNESDMLVENNEAKRLLSRASKRVERSTAAGMTMPSAEPSRNYAAAAYHDDTNVAPPFSLFGSTPPAPESTPDTASAGAGSRPSMPR